MAIFYLTDAFARTHFVLPYTSSDVVWLLKLSHVIIPWVAGRFGTAGADRLRAPIVPVFNLSTLQGEIPSPNSLG